MDKCCCGTGKFVMGMVAGMAVGAAVGATMAPPSSQIKRTAHKAAKRLNDAVDRLTETLDL